MAKAFFSGLTEPIIMDNGKIIKCMAKENLSGPMEEHIRVTMQMTRSMVKVFIHGLTEECIKEGFIMVNSTAKEFIDKRQDKKFTAFGKKERRVKFAKITTNFWHLRITCEQF